MPPDTSRWVRFAVVGPLLAAPPAHGKLRAETAGATGLATSGDRRAGALLLRDDRTLAGAASRTGSCRGSPSAGAVGCRAIAHAVRTAGVAGAVPTTSQLVGATAPRQPQGTSGERPVARFAAVPPWHATCERTGCSANGGRSGRERQRQRRGANSARYAVTSIPTACGLPLAPRARQAGAMAYAAAAGCP